MGGELEEAAKVGLPKFIAAQQRRARAAFQVQRKMRPPKGQRRAHGADESLVRPTSDPAGGEVQTGLQTPLPREGPSPRQVPLGERLGLEKLRVQGRGGEAAAQPGGIQAQTFPTETSRAREKAADQPSRN